MTEDTVRLISEKKNEPEWMLEFRLKAYRHWLTMDGARNWPNLDYPEVDYQDIIYYSAPKQKRRKLVLDEVDPELLKTFEKLGFRSTSKNSWLASQSMLCLIPFPSQRLTKKS